MGHGPKQWKDNVTSIAPRLSAAHVTRTRGEGHQRLDRGTAEADGGPKSQHPGVPRAHPRRLDRKLYHLRDVEA